MAGKTLGMELLCAQARRFGHEVITANSVQEALTDPNIKLENVGAFIRLEPPPFDSAKAIEAIAVKAAKEPLFLPSPKVRGKHNGHRRGAFGKPKRW